MQIKKLIIMNNTNSVIFRIFNKYGTGEMYNEYRSAISRFVFSNLKGKPPLN